MKDFFEGHRHKNPKFVYLTQADYYGTCLGWFLLIFPYSYLQGTLLMETNDVIDEREFSMGEILKCIGLWILIATLVTSCDKLSWFGNTNKISEWEGAPFRIHKYMS